MNWAIINGEKKTGVTMFYIADDIDAGDIIAQKETSIDATDDVETLDRKITCLYLELIEENLPLIADGRAPRTSQDHSKATYTCKRIPEDGLIQWSRPASEIHNLIRGVTRPYPGAFTFVRTSIGVEKLYVWSASLPSIQEAYVGYVPGRVVEILEGRGVKVLADDGTTLVLEDVELETQKKRVKADQVQVLRSVKTTLGTYA